MVFGIKNLLVGKFGTLYTETLQCTTICLVMCLSFGSMYAFSTIKRVSERMQSDLQQIKGVDASHRIQLTIDDSAPEMLWILVKNHANIATSTSTMVEFINE